MFCSVGWGYDCSPHFLLFFCLSSPLSFLSVSLCCSSSSLSVLTNFLLIQLFHVGMVTLPVDQFHVGMVTLLVGQFHVNMDYTCCEFFVAMITLPVGSSVLVWLHFLWAVPCWYGYTSCGQFRVGMVSLPVGSSVLVWLHFLWAGLCWPDYTTCWPVSQWHGSTSCFTLAWFHFLFQIGMVPLPVGPVHCTVG